MAFRLQMPQLPLYSQICLKNNERERERERKGEVKALI